MHSNWITESHEIWLRGDDVDLEAVRSSLLCSACTKRCARVLQDIDSLSSLE